MDLLLEVGGDALAHELERQLAALDAAVEAHDVQAVAAFDGLGMDGADLQARQRGVELGDGLSRTDLAEIAALPGRRAGGVKGGGLGKVLRMLLQLVEK